jgi:hypothetical protein
VTDEQRPKAEKPLVSPVREYRWIGLADLVVGTAFGVAALAVEPVPQALFSLAFFGISFGLAMHFVAVRRGVAAAVESLPAPPTAERESREATARRVILNLALTGVGLALVVLLFGRATFAAGAALGMGGALLVTSYWLESWQRQASVLILREPATGGVAAGSPTGVISMGSKRLAQLAECMCARPLPFRRQS